MSDHYRRDQITKCVNSHTGGALRLHLLANGNGRDVTTKYLNVTPDEVRAIAELLDRNDNPPAAGDVVATPLNGIQSGEHYRRCTELAEYARDLCDLDPWYVTKNIGTDTVANWFAYLAGSTNERPW